MTRAEHACALANVRSPSSLPPAGSASFISGSCVGIILLARGRSRLSGCAPSAVRLVRRHHRSPIEASSRTSRRWRSRSVVNRTYSAGGAGLNDYLKQHWHMTQRRYSLVDPSLAGTLPIFDVAKGGKRYFISIFLLLGPSRALAYSGLKNAQVEQQQS